jgi:hypothetical protein
VIESVFGRFQLDAKLCASRKARRTRVRAPVPVTALVWVGFAGRWSNVRAGAIRIYPAGSIRERGARWRGLFCDGLLRHSSPSMRPLDAERCPLDSDFALPRIPGRDICAAIELRKPLCVPPRATTGKLGLAVSIFDKLKSFFGGSPPKEAREADEDVPDEGPEDWSEKRRTSPEDDARIEREARAAFDRKDAAAAIQLLGRCAMLAKHEPNSLPCLCRRCLNAELDKAESGGIAYVRDFVVAKHRVLFYWTPRELAGSATQVRASMRATLSARIRELRIKGEEGGVRTNPFTGLDIVVPPRQEPPRVNPFTGKKVP